MNNTLKKACHAIGMDNRDTFMKYGKKRFISYRNYYSSDPSGDVHMDSLVAKGLAAVSRVGENGLNYRLTEKGFEWIEGQCDMVVYSDSRPEKDYPLSDDDIYQIEEIWLWLEDNDFYTSEFSEELDVAIWFDSNNGNLFLEHFGSDMSPIPARIFDGSIMVLFTDLLDFKVTGKQIWSFRPEDMRDVW